MRIRVREMQDDPTHGADDVSAEFEKRLAQRADLGAGERGPLAKPPVGTARLPFTRTPW
jgi:hypothetical protein